MFSLLCPDYFRLKRALQVKTIDIHKQSFYIPIAVNVLSKFIKADKRVDEVKSICRKRKLR